MTTRPPTITVAVPCYNYGHYLPTCIDSIQQQEGVEIDIVIVDDGSTDGSDAVVREMVDRYDNVRAIFHQPNAGHIQTFTDGVAAATGEYVLLISADDCLAPGALQRAVTVMEEHPDVGLVYGRVDVFDQVIPLPEDPAPAQSVVIWKGWDWIAERCATAANPTYSPEVILRTSVQHAIGGYDPECRHTSDFNMWLRAAAVAGVARIDGPVLAHYRVHGGNMSRTMFKSDYVQIEQRMRAIDRFFETLPSLDAQHHELRQRAGTAISRAAVNEAIRQVRLRPVAETDHALLVALAERTDASVLQSWLGRELRGRVRLGRIACRVLPPFVILDAIRAGRHRRRERRRLSEGRFGD
jgi:glycosyltransferase involved in cell wall biosynthesis